jgi:hypothetical protein
MTLGEALRRRYAAGVAAWEVDGKLIPRTGFETKTPAGTASERSTRRDCVLV